ncbi:MAG TPA: hypothetical protein DHV65_01500 [Ktedonobacter sp.]|nr:hypothetical protein [Ktedonobacter sp.]HCJ32961.1 hypothetical protein [Ktedonobacter sp.]
MVLTRAKTVLVKLRALPDAWVVQPHCLWMVTSGQVWQGKVLWLPANGSFRGMGKYLLHQVSCAFVVDACALLAIVEDEPGATGEVAERVGALHSIGTPSPVQPQANFPYQRLVPGSAAALADMAVPALLVIAVDIWEGVVVVGVGVEDTLVAVTQLVTAAPMCLVVPVRIASHSNHVAPAVPVLVVALAVIVLRFPLCSLYASIFNVFQVIIGAFR